MISPDESAAQGRAVEVEGERALKAPVLQGDKWFGVKAGSPSSGGRPLFKVDNAARLKVRLRVEQACRVVIQGKNLTQNDNFNTQVEVEPGAWRELELPFAQFKDTSQCGSICQTSGPGTCRRRGSGPFLAEMFPRSLRMVRR